MKFFDKFTETIFLKENSKLEEKIKKLSTLQEQYPNDEKIKKNLLFYKLGLSGEKEIEFELKNANLGMYVLHDITLKYEDLTAQIDYIFVTTGKVYLIECKNMIGNITVNERGDFIREVNGKKEGIYSPIRQAERHVEILKKIWLSGGGILNKLFTAGRFDNWYVPLVVMANSKNILNTKYAPQEYKRKIIKSDQLINYIKRDIKSIDKSLLNNKRKMEETAKWLLQLDTPQSSDDLKIENLEEFSEINLDLDKQVIKKRLIEFRANKSKQKNIPAYYIFTNDELEQIVKSMPKNLEELKSLDVLSEVKLKLHGAEIVDVIQNK